MDDETGGVASEAETDDAARDAAKEAAAFSLALTPGLFMERIRGRDAATLGLVFSELHELGARAWMGMALVIAEAQSQAGYGDDALGAISTEFGIHKHYAAKLGRLAREVLIPRIEQVGPTTEFQLAEQAWYQVAIEAAPKESIPPVEVLGRLEERKSQDVKYSARRAREEYELGDEGKTISEGGSVGRLLARLAKVEDSALDDWLAEAGGKQIAKERARVFDAFVVVNRALELFKAKFPLPGDEPATPEDDAAGADDGPEPTDDDLAQDENPNGAAR